MSRLSDIELRRWMDSHQVPDYTDEAVQKIMVIFEEHGASVTLYDWIHRYDVCVPTRILDLGELEREANREFRETLSKFITTMEKSK